MYLRDHLPGDGLLILARQAVELPDVGRPELVHPLQVAVGSTKATNTSWYVNLIEP